MNFNLTENSPCINSGNPYIIDSDGSISDLGAITYNYSIECSLAGDINYDNEINVLDIVEIINCILSNFCTNCSDMNDDGITNVLDVVAIINIIIN